MAFKFRCPMCGKQLAVNEPPGATVGCPHCNRSVGVPQDAQQADGGVAPARPLSPVEEQEEAEEQAGMDTMMGWLALYLPSWGTSVLLHAAVILLAALFTWRSYEGQMPFEYRSVVVSQQKRKVTERQRLKSPEPSRGKMTPRPSSIVHHLTNPFPDVADNQMEVLEVIGVGGGGKELGGFEGLGSGGRGFFGAGGDVEEARRIVYVVDRSGSMTDSIDYVKWELKRSIGELDEAKEFHVIFYSSGPPLEMPTRRLVSATDHNKEMAFEFVDNVIAELGTDPSKALQRAFACQPELIYLLTDGEFDKAIVGQVKDLNSDGRVTVHTIGFLYRIGEAVLKQIADENNGNYKFVSERDLEALVR
ncbi:MAG TPA: VWA domain-containing protein [Phycisphaerae bacterium]|nr:VWA domain-containing protein [Phycisphaerae bacterium]